MGQWVNICGSIDDILPATGVCALPVGSRWRSSVPTHDDRVFAISNIDPFFNASVHLSRGIIAEHDGALWVASPLKKTALPA